ncbi:MAG: cobalamin biosynthesis protein CobD [Fibrobacteria bacterium]|nr:cobalamin biosynthesis protein CobD [Fibrobacteria bacterium]
MLQLDIILAFFLDLIIGDPHRFPHPVRGIGFLITWLESKTRMVIKNEFKAGLLTVFITVTMSAGVVWLSLFLAGMAGIFFKHVLIIYWIYAGLSIKDMGLAASKVYEDLQAKQLESARKSVSMIVGRDTENLDEIGIRRAAIESTAESTVDGIIAPLFYTLIGGPVLLWFYKAASTCDSMLGYKNEKYIYFGKAAARLDDFLNWPPARLCYVLFPLAARFLGYAHTDSYETAVRDGHKHKSPNAGIPEAAMAGALKVKLGGPDMQGGVLRPKTFFGSEFKDPVPGDILRAINMMWTVSVTAIACGVFLLVVL